MSRWYVAFSLPETLLSSFPPSSRPAVPTTLHAFAAMQEATPPPPKKKTIFMLTPSCRVSLVPVHRLINYTPSATAFRLVSVSALNGYLQSWTLHLSGSSQDPFLLLPTWITITSVCPRSPRPFS